MEQNIEGEIYSINHLNLIIKKYKYKNPIYSSNLTSEFKSLKNPEKIQMFNLLDFIVIKEKDNNSQYKKVYADLKTIYQKKDNDIYGNKIKLEFLSMNFEKYYSFNNGHNSKGNNIEIFLSNIRLKIFTEVRNFLKDKEKIYVICGPFGIGKSFTALALQKDLILIILLLFI